jgi:hypothetical protein
MRSLLFASVLAVAVSGCISERDYAPNDERSDFTTDFGDRNDVDWGDEVEPQPEEDFYGALPISNGRVQGDIGGVTNFDAPTDYVDSWGDEQWASVTLNATDEQGRVGMIILEVGNMNIMDAPAGTYRASNVDGGGEIYVTGCSSDTDSFYDAPAEDGTIILEDNPDGTRDVEIQATLPGDAGNTSASAQFTLE